MQAIHAGFFAGDFTLADCHLIVALMRAILATAVVVMVIATCAVIAERYRAKSERNRTREPHTCNNSYLPQNPSPPFFDRLPGMIFAASSF